MLDSLSTLMLSVVLCMLTPFVYKRSDMFICTMVTTFVNPFVYYVGQSAIPHYSKEQSAPL